MRFLAVFQAAFGLCLLLPAIWLAYSHFSVLHHMVSGTPWSNFFIALSGALVWSSPLIALAVWVLILARMLWALDKNACPVVIVTHVFLLVTGSLAVVYGVYTLRAAERSAAKGGGLLGTFGMIPLGLGTILMAFALCSIAMALGVIFGKNVHGQECPRPKQRQEK